MKTPPIIDGERAQHAPLSPDPSPPARSLAVDVSHAFDVGRESDNTPPASPHPRGGKHGAGKRKRQPRPPNIRDVRRHIAAAWTMKTGKRYFWTPLSRANVRTMMRVYRAAEMMALWDLYIETPHCAYLVYFMEREAGRLMDDPRFKPLVKKYDEMLFKSSGRDLLSRINQ